MPSELSKKIAKNLRRIRKERGLTQSELSTKAGFSINYISQVERRLIEPTTGSIDKICKVLRVSASDLLKD